MYQKTGTEIQYLQAFAKNLIKIKNTNTLINSPKNPIKKGAKQVQKSCKIQGNFKEKKHKKCPYPS
ncbi:MAG TPA: hypothetical protein DDX14_09375 [Cyanobacteria bacterium UBA9579]|nr:hypothetical protein [Cyanobacteria bacterium UBA9579]